VLGDKDFTVSPNGTGFHLDRKRFDTFLAQCPGKLPDSARAGVEGTMRQGHPRHRNPPRPLPAGISRHNAAPSLMAT
jgi:hypothetical protein